MKEMGPSSLRNIDESRVGAYAEKPLRDLARESDITKEEKKVIDSIAIRRGEKAMEEYRIDLENNTLVITEKEPSPNIISSDDLKAIDDANERRNTQKERKEGSDEVCKKYKEGDIFDFSLESRDGTYTILLEGKDVGSFLIMDSGKNSGVKCVVLFIVNDNLKNKGFGQQFYTRLARYLRYKDGSVLMKETEDSGHTDLITF